MRQIFAASDTHAIVMGGSMAGLLAARVLAEHFATVTLIERDTLSPCSVSRRGTPQDRHTHGLLASGRQVLDDLFPGFSWDLADQGAIRCDILRDARWHLEGGDLARPMSGLQGLMASRPLLEAAVRARVLRLPNLTLREGSQVSGLTISRAGDRVTGVRLTGGATLPADLVVDATGRGSRSPRWLTELGYDAPAEERVGINLSYTTRWFRRRPEHLDGDVAAITPPTPDGKRGGVMLAQEGDRWTVTLIAHFVEPAPMDLEGFTTFAASLPSPAIHDVIRRADALDEAVTARFPASVRRRYERLRRFPERYVVLGDGLCSFNPIYGQGMSVAALEAVALGDTVAGSAQEVGRRFFRRASAIVDTPWTTAVGNDLRMPETEGPHHPITAVINRYMSHLHRAAHHDPVLARRFMEVASLLAPPSAVFHPRILWRVIRGDVRTRLVGPHAGQPSISPRAGRPCPREAGTA